MQINDELKKIGEDEYFCFYWHRHPGSAAHSSTDEEDTYGTFMTESAGRPFFVFMQTADKGNGDMDYEMRIDIRRPVRATIENDSVDLYYEESEEEIKRAEDCRKIIDEVVTESSYIPAKTQINVASKQDMKDYFKTQGQPSRNESYVGQTTIERLFNTERNGEYVDNSLFAGVAVDKTEQASFEFKDGGCVIKAGKMFQKVIDEALAEKGLLNKLVRRHTTDAKQNTKTMKVYKIQPAAKSYQAMKDAVAERFLKYHEVLKRVWDKQEQKEEEEDFNVAKAKEYTISENKEKLIEEIIQGLYSHAMVDWSDYTSKKGLTFASVLGFDDQQLIGCIEVDKKFENAKFSGEELIKIVNTLETEMFENDIAKEQEAQGQLEHEFNRGRKNDYIG
ncbi:hypothetical protein [Oceanihabitans sediminis]|uniref:hypothetical protein n=1 Tax=Oceanihabitans sediminis TaxID=1812012 RepID=UPI00299DA20A|nr:hypothetical protein [Oceanihabitans sediminis]MDX1279243.1 hypothetical protein [Oceanihabitans sediminis]